MHARRLRHSPFFDEVDAEDLRLDDDDMRVAEEDLDAEVLIERLGEDTLRFGEEAFFFGEDTLRFGDDESETTTVSLTFRMDSRTSFGENSTVIGNSGASKPFFAHHPSRSLNTYIITSPSLSSCIAVIEFFLHTRGFSPRTLTTTYLFPGFT